MRADQEPLRRRQRVGRVRHGRPGLREVSNPSAIFLSRHDQPVSGSVVMVTREGTRPMLVEVQALVDESLWPIRGG